MSVVLKGRLKLTTIEAKTGKILDIDEGSNLVLHSGVMAIARLFTGQTILPSDISMPINSFNTLGEIEPMKDIAKYFQLGTNADAVYYGQVSQFDNGTLDENSVTPINASPIFPVEATIGTEGTVKFSCTLLGNQGNAVNGVADMTYTEAVLMGIESITPLRYNWLARRVFSGKIKNPDLILQADWFMNFSVEEQVS